ncbi:SAM-dependent methyltransferase [Corynebacterium pelargi]|uniref:Magnesium-protoporphyrin O-methyltransferase n=2 Tax=Corynebacterium pelargi TaxID=1471400 RepID=A0A410W8Y3_9CORY|nr:Magnesium-protoporphyrin O-methyltransferase [Corynebacterium pelargi]GGG67861.1 SAM-dependent methyltransferase [Corynebacterium pelargi]
MSNVEGVRVPIIADMPTWKEITSQNPEHSKNYAARWDRLEAQGNDIVGEARLIDAMAPRGAKILDAGCGQGRIGGYLQQRGHDVTGVDLDPLLIQQAQQRYPDATWIVGDLSEGPEIQGGFTLGVCAGNVLTFLAPEQRRPALEYLYQVMGSPSRLVVGFGAGRGYSFPAFFEDAQAEGFDVQQRFSSWDLQPFRQHSDFLVAVLSK